jgi:hypothetical protein
MIMRSLKAARLSHLTLATLLASGSLAFAAGCSSEDNAPSEDVNDLQPGDDDDDDSEPLPPAPTQSSNPEPPPPAAVPGAPGANGLELPEDFLDWRVIGAAMPNGDTPSIRVILGNDTAVDAARLGQTNPWPDGSMLGHIVWTQGENDDSAGVVVPGNFGAFTLMSKDSDEYAADGGWAYGRWAGENLTPLAAGADRACVDCHTDNVRDFDYVFTRPGQHPSLNAVNSAGTAPNGLKIPTEVLNWRVIGIAQPGGDSPSFRVIVGNDTAVDAARAGDTNPWPENSAIAHYVWGVGENENSPDTIVPGDFAALTFMVRNEVAFGDDGNWAFSVWSGPNLTAPEAVGFDQVCIDCHEARVPDNDRVFTRPGALPEAFFER